MCHYGLQSADLSIGKVLGSRPYGFGEAGQDRSVGPIGLGEGPRGPGELTHLRGIDHHYRQSLCGKAPTTVRSKPPVASRTTIARGTLLFEATEQGVDPAVVVSDEESLLPFVPFGFAPSQADFSRRSLETSTPAKSRRSEERRVGKECR